MIREGGSASRVSMHARPRDPGGGTVSTDPPRRTVLNDVSVAVEQPGEEPSLVSYKCVSYVQCKLYRLRLRTIINRSVLMMLLDYTRIRALCGIQMIVCIGRMLQTCKSPYGGGVSMRPMQGFLQNKILLVIYRTGIGRWIWITY